MLKTGIQTVEKNGIRYIVRNGKCVKYTSWAGDLFAKRYEKMMRDNVFPRLFDADYAVHNDILKKAYSGLHNQYILELGTGSGTAAMMLHGSNRYTGIDVSRRLLSMAAASFKSAGFCDAAMYLCSADHLPFAADAFDVGICNLSLNFFPNLGRVLSLLHNTLKTGGRFICSVPVVERIPKGRKIRGTQFTQSSLAERMRSHGFGYTELPEKNGAVVYFVCEK